MGINTMKSDETGEKNMNELTSLSVHGMGGHAAESSPTCGG